jgi:uncharacterized protein YceK
MKKLLSLLVIGLLLTGCSTVTKPTPTDEPTTCTTYDPNDRTDPCWQPPYRRVEKVG